MDKQTAISELLSGLKLNISYSFDHTNNKKSNAPLHKKSNTPKKEKPAPLHKKSNAPKKEKPAPKKKNTNDRDKLKKDLIKLIKQL